MKATSVVAAVVGEVVAVEIFVVEWMGFCRLAAMVA